MTRSPRVTTSVEPKRCVAFEAPQIDPQTGDAPNSVVVYQSNRTTYIVRKNSKEKESENCHAEKALRIHAD